MLVSAYCWQIQNLLNSLTELNYNNNKKEINNIVMSLGENGRSVLISSLLDEIDFRDGFPKDIQRVSFISFYSFYCLYFISL